MKPTYLSYHINSSSSFYIILIYRNELKRFYWQIILAGFESIFAFILFGYTVFTGSNNLRICSLRSIILENVAGFPLIYSEILQQ